MVPLQSPDASLNRTFFFSKREQEKMLHICFVVTPDLRCGNQRSLRTNSRTLKIRLVLSCPNLLGSESERNYELLITFSNRWHFCHPTLGQPANGAPALMKETLQWVMQMWCIKNHTHPHTHDRSDRERERRTLPKGMWNEASKHETLLCVHQAHTVQCEIIVRLPHFNSYWLT